MKPPARPLVDENEGKQGVAADAAALAPSGSSRSASRAEPPAANAGAWEPATGYSDAFYQVGKMLGIPAQDKSPAEVWHEQMLPMLEAAKAVIVEANNSLYGSQGFFLSANGGPVDKYHLARPIEELKRRSNKLWRDREELLEALEALLAHPGTHHSSCIHWTQVGCDCDFAEVASQARAAIAKATGADMGRPVPDHASGPA